MNVDLWFPTSILHTNLQTNYEVLIKEAYNIQNTYPIGTKWHCKTYNSLESYDLLRNKIFNPLITDLLKIVKDFAVYHNIKDRELICDEAWINIAKPGDYQEHHIHANSHFSLVFYIKTQEKCGNIVFKNPVSNFDMFPLPLDKDGLCSSTYTTCSYTPENGKVLCFRSFLSHMVETNESNEERISLALNIKVR
jgi:uncharacterized protein (TIGR02466 family)